MRTDPRRMDKALADLRDGRAVVLIDSWSRSPYGDIVFSAELATPALVGFAVRYSTGFLCVPMPESRCDELNLPPMRGCHGSDPGQKFAVAVDAACDVTTGISAADRGRTCQVLADSGSRATDLNRPGQVVPVRASDGGVLVRPGRAESATDLLRSADLAPVAVTGGVVSERDPRLMAGQEELIWFAAEHDLAWVTGDEVVRHRHRLGLAGRVSDRVDAL